MDPITLLILGIVALASTGASVGVSAYNNAKNIEYQQQANTQNIEYQKEVNAQNQYNLEHQHQIEMEDLKAAGLNPILTATGGSGAGQAYLNAPQVKAPQMDLSGITSALGGMQHMVTSAMMMKMFAANQAARNETLSAIASSKNAQSAANAALRADTALTKQKMSNIFSQYNLTHQAVKGASYINSAKDFEENFSKAEIKKIQEILKYNLWKK